ncbi:MAG: serine--tRNA ligase [Bacteroidota bacterium]
MLELQKLRSYKEDIINKLKKRGIDAQSSIEGILADDERRRSVQQQLDQTLAESNNLAKQIGQLMKQGQKEEAEKIKRKTAELKESSKRLSEDLATSQDKIADALLNIPNAPHNDVPSGTNEEDNIVLEEFGEIPELYSKAVPHWELISRYDIVDFELGNKVTGAGFPFYKGKGARLQRALLNFFLDEASEAGYLEVQPPVVINKDSGQATGQLPDKEGQMYDLAGTDYFLIPTAEVPITNMYRGEIIEEKKLPIKNTAYSPCFRREAGSWGSHVRGLNRLHQFDKVELVRIEKPENSYEALEEMGKHVGSLLEKLELPYRILLLCGGDLGFTSAKTYDFEVFSTAQKKWLEVSSVSNFETYQSNRLKLRYKDSTKKSQLLHTLNGSALAFPRILAAILENNQTEEGIRIPKVLHKYAGFEMIN